MIKCFECGGNYRTIDCLIVHEQREKYNRNPLPPRSGSVILNHDGNESTSTNVIDEDCLAVVTKFRKMATTYEPIKECELTKAYNTQYWACVEQIQQNV